MAGEDQSFVETRVISIRFPSFVIIKTRRVPSGKVCSNPMIRTHCAAACATSAPTMAPTKMKVPSWWNTGAAKPDHPHLVLGSGPDASVTSAKPQKAIVLSPITPVAKAPLTHTDDDFINSEAGVKHKVSKIRTDKPTL